MGKVSLFVKLNLLTLV